MDARVDTVDCPMDTELMRTRTPFGEFLVMTIVGLATLVSPRPCLAEHEERGAYQFFGISGALSPVWGDFDGKTVLANDTLLPSLGLGRGLGGDYGLSLNWFAAGITGRYTWYGAHHDTAYTTTNGWGIPVPHRVESASQADIGLFMTLKLSTDRDLRPYLRLGCDLSYMSVQNATRSLYDNSVGDAFFSGWGLEPAIGVEYSGLFPVKFDLRIAARLASYDTDGNAVAARGVVVSLGVLYYTNESVIFSRI